ncbi:MLO-like protein [Drosera capensis]
MGEGDRDSLEYTPTWIVAAVCAVMVFISVVAERGLHRLGKGKAALMSVEALHQLHIFIFVLAVAYVTSSAITMVLGGMKSQVDLNKFMLAITINSSNALTHCPTNHGFDFHKYMMRTLEVDFKKVVGLLVLVGAKLEHIITSLAEEIELKTTENSGEKKDGEVKEEGEPWVKPSDKHFWFGRPQLVLYLIHFILFQNSFETAFLFWVMLLDTSPNSFPVLNFWVIVQVLCSYSTLPLYTIVTQMGSNFKQGIFNQTIHSLMEIWAEDSRVRAGMDRNETQRMSSELLQVSSEAQGLDDLVEASTPSPRELPLEIYGAAAF